MSEAPKAEARVIPGLGAISGGKGSSGGSKRSRPKASASKNQASAISELSAPSESTAAPQGSTKEKPANLHLNPEALLVPQDDGPSDIPPKVPASTIVGKRVKGLQKKLQRIQSYTDSTATLNEDQRKAVQSKPALESTIKELQDVVKLLEQDEVEQDKHQAARSAQDEKRVQAKISLAVHESQKQAQSDLTMLLQFFHLSNLFSPDQGFNPPALPAVVQKATGQEMAACKTLQEAFINGPLLGGGDDAFERLVKLAKADESDVVDGVSYARVKQMVLDLSAAPGEVGPDNASAAGDEASHINGHANITDEDRSAAQEAAQHVQAAPSLNFMQASELEEPQPQPAPPQKPAEATDNSPWNDSAAAVDNSPWGAPQPQPPTQQAIQSLGTGAPETWGSFNDQTDAVNSWADDVEQARETPTEPSQPSTAQGAAAAAAQSTVTPDVTVPETNGATGAPQEKQSRGRGRGGRGHQRGEGRGRGGNNSRASGRGHARQGNGAQQKDAGEGDDWVKVSSSHPPQQRGRGRGRGGARGRGDGMRGRGPQQQQQQQATQA